MTDRKVGRKPVELDSDKLNMMLAMGVPKARIAREFVVSRTTLYKKIGESVNEKS